jgi:hypothetical protein
MEWNFKDPTSANTPRCMHAMAAGAGLFDSGVFGCEVESGWGLQKSRVSSFRNEGLVVQDDIEK